MKGILVILLILLLGLGIVIYLEHPPGNGIKKESSFVRIKNTEIIVEKADTIEERVRGLSGREKLEEGHGMLFIFDSSDMHSFWMKDMHFPIDIIWINKDMEIVYIEEKVSPNSFPESFLPDKRAKYVLEVNSGFVEKNNVDVGNNVEINLK